MISFMLISDYLLVQILRITLKYKSEVFLGLFADARIGILGLSQAGAWEGDTWSDEQLLLVVLLVLL